MEQRDIADAVDIASAHKSFELNLEQFGPYRVDYTRNGRCALLVECYKLAVCSRSSGPDTSRFIL